MPYLYLNGQKVSAEHESDVEVVPATTNCNSSGSYTNHNDSSKTFFAQYLNNDGTADGGQVIINDVTDKGYKLITSDSATVIDSLKNQDVFKSKLTITTKSSTVVPQYYCKRGYAPVGQWLLTVEPGTYTMTKYASGLCVVTDTSGAVKGTLSTAAQCRAVYTFAICAGGGGGETGKEHIFTFADGAGGGGGGGAVITLIFNELGMSTDLSFTLTVGAGGSGGGSSSGSNGSGGGASSLKLVNPAVTIVTCNGGGGGSGSGASPGGGGSVSAISSIIGNSTYDYGEVITQVSRSGWTGQRGDNEDYNNGEIYTDKIDVPNWTVTDTWMNTVGGYQSISGTGVIFGDWGNDDLSGGGPSIFGYGNTDNYGPDSNLTWNTTPVSPNWGNPSRTFRSWGGGGTGGYGQGTDHSSGTKGGAGFISIFY